MPENSLITRVADRYRQKGWTVTLEPSPDKIPFDLGSYRPDLLAEKPGDEYLVIEVREKSARLSPEKVIAASEEVARHPGWKFVLVTGEDLDRDKSLISWADIRERLKEIKPGETKAMSQGMFLILWSSVEALLRRRIVDLKGPLSRSPIKLVMKSLVDYGELTAQQEKTLSKYLTLRSELTHGISDRTVTADDFRTLANIARDLLTQWSK